MSIGPLVEGRHLLDSFYMLPFVPFLYNKVKQSESDRSACTWGEFEQYNIQHILSKYNTHSFMLPVLIYLQTIDEERALHFICENDKNYFEKANKEQQIWGALRQDHKR